MSKIKVLHVLGTLNRGGAELRTIELIQKSSNQTYEFHICSITDKKGSLDKLAINSNCKIHYVKLDKYFISNFKKLINSFQFDIVHSHLYLFSGIIMKLSHSCKVPKRITHIRTLNNSESNSLIKLIKKLFLKFMIKKYSTNIVGVSEAVLESLWGGEWKNNRKFIKIYDGIEGKDYENHADKSTILKNLKIQCGRDIYLHIGRFSKVKNQERLISIFKEINNINKNSHLIMVGDGDKNIIKKIREEIKESKIEKYVTFTGELENVNHILSICDLLIFPSLWEGLGNVVIEASIVKKPVLASDIKSLNEIKSYFPSMHTLSLEESDRKWAMEALKLVEKYKSNIIEFKKLDGTPFEIAHSVQEFEKLWYIKK